MQNPTIYIPNQVTAALEQTFSKHYIISTLLVNIKDPSVSHCSVPKATKILENF